MTRHSSSSRHAARMAGFVSAVVFFAVLTQAIPSQAQVTSRSVVVTQTKGHGLSAVRLHGTRTITTTTLSQTLVFREPQPAPGGIVPFSLLPAVAGIRQTPVAPPTVYRIAGPRTAMHEADEMRMRQVNPGARVITPGDVDLSHETRRRYAVNEPGQPRMMSGPRMSGPRVIGPRVIVVIPE